MGREYALLDSGSGRRLERFGEVLVDRPAPGARERPRQPDAWGAAEAIFTDGAWDLRRSLPGAWLVEIDGLTFELAPTDAGQVGVFPEHATTWRWLRERIAERQGPEPARILHLFAYTGGATLAAAAAGAAVAHVDASRPAVAWARRNAERSGLAHRSIRWLVDDAPAFVGRERRRGHRYDVIVLDPPSYGHGPRGAPWRLLDQLDDLLHDCVACLAAGGCLLLTAHTTGLGASPLASRLSAALAGSEPPAGRWSVSAGDLGISARSGARLQLGAWAVAGGPPIDRAPAR